MYEGGGSAAHTLVASRAELRRWTRRVAERWSEQRRSARFGLFALSHNLLYAGALLAMMGV